MNASRKPLVEDVDVRSLMACDTENLFNNAHSSHGVLNAIVRCVFVVFRFIPYNLIMKLVRFAFISREKPVGSDT